MNADSDEDTNQVPITTHVETLETRLDSQSVIPESASLPQEVIPAFESCIAEDLVLAQQCSDCIGAVSEQNFLSTLTQSTNSTSTNTTTQNAPNGCWIFLWTGNCPRRHLCKYNHDSTSMAALWEWMFGKLKKSPFSRDNLKKRDPQQSNPNTSGMQHRKAPNTPQRSVSFLQRPTRDTNT